MYSVVIRQLDYDATLSSSQHGSEYVSNCPVAPIFLVYTIVPWSFGSKLYHRLDLLLI